MSYRSEPADKWVAVTPSDSVDITPTPRGLWVETAGVVALVGRDGGVVNFTLEAKQVYPLGPKRVNLTNTTALGIVALY